MFATICGSRGRPGKWRQQCRRSTAGTARLYVIAGLSDNEAIDATIERTGLPEACGRRWESPVPAGTTVSLHYWRVDGVKIRSTPEIMLTRHQIGFTIRNQLRRYGAHDQHRSIRKSKPAGRANPQTIVVGVFNDDPNQSIRLIWRRQRRLRGRDCSATFYGADSRPCNLYGRYSRASSDGIPNRSGQRHSTT